MCGHGSGERRGGATRAPARGSKRRPKWGERGPGIRQRVTTVAQWGPHAYMTMTENIDSSDRRQCDND